MMVEADANWEDPALKRWFGSILRDGTRYNYRTAFRAYAPFTGMTASALIDEALEDIRNLSDYLILKAQGVQGLAADRVPVNKIFVEQPSSEPKVKVLIQIYAPLQISKCKKCGKVVAEPKELIGMTKSQRT